MMCLLTILDAGGILIKAVSESRDTGVDLETQLIKRLCRWLRSRIRPNPHEVLFHLRAFHFRQLCSLGKLSQIEMGLNCIAASLVSILLVTSFPASTWAFTVTRHRGSLIRSALRRREAAVSSPLSRTRPRCFSDYHGIAVDEAPIDTTIKCWQPCWTTRWSLRYVVRTCTMCASSVTPPYTDVYDTGRVAPDVAFRIEFYFTNVLVSCHITVVVAT